MSDESERAEDQVGSLTARLTRAVAAGPDPVDGAARLLRFLDAARAEAGGGAACVPDEAAEALLALLLGQSGWCSRELIREPARLAALARDPWLGREKPEAVMRAELEAETAAGDVVAALRRFRNREYLRLGARELGHGRPEEVGRELAALASVCLDGAVVVAARELRARFGEPQTDEGERCRFVVMGMGKLGGEELNFSSDVDLIYLYETDRGEAGRLSLHEYFSKLAERVTRLVAEQTVDGSCFRVDLRLRPEGTQGPLVNSLEAAERYYESWGRPWERQAWIKARAVAGERALGDEALRMLAPMVWPKSGVASAVEDVRALMARVRAELDDLDDVKLGPGGIREIEFFVQALQLVHGGRRPELRERGTLRTLDRLLFAGLVSEREHRALCEAYVYLRRVEHRLQLDELRQTHALPHGDEACALLARRLGYPDFTAFDEALRAQRAVVSSIYATLGRPSEGPPPEVATLLDPTSDRVALERALAALGYLDVPTSADELELLRKKPHSPFAPTATGAAARAAPLLLAETAASPDPDLALRRLVDLATRGLVAETVWRLAGDAPAIGRLLVSLFGTSEFLAKILVAHPALAEHLLTATPGAGFAFRTREQHHAAITTSWASWERLGGGASPDDGDAAPDAAIEEDRLDALRRYKNAEFLRIGLRDVGGELDAEEVGRALSALAEASLEATLEIVTPSVVRRWGRPETPLVVLALGKLGGEEMTYSSDLDLVFVFGDEAAPIVDGRASGATTFEVMSRLSQRVLRGLSAHLAAGRLYEVDTRLRPSGQQGALVSSLAGFARYHRGEAAPWERQALLKARVVAGDARLGEEVQAVIDEQLWRRRERDEAQEAAMAREIARLRGRMERERSQVHAGGWDIKTGRGGLLDVEFLVQFLQLVHGPAHPELRLRATAPALAALHRIGLLDDADHAALDSAWRFLRRLDGRLRIVHDRPTSELPAAPRQLDKLARRLGLHGEAPGAHLRDEYLQHADRVRALFARLVSVVE